MLPIMAIWLPPPPWKIKNYLATLLHAKQMNYLATLLQAKQMLALTNCTKSGGFFQELSQVFLLK